jgi:DNA-binding beta-propeller fold protein YncE
MRRSVVVLPSVALLIALVVVGPAATIAQDATPTTPEPGFVSLFDGSEESFADWRSTGTGTFDLIDGAIVTGSDTNELGDLSLLYYEPRTFDNFVLRLQFRVSDPADNSGVLVRFRDPSEPIPAADLAARNAAETYPSHDMYSEDSFWIASDTGFEVQIDDSSDNPTGVIYDIPVGTGPGEQDYQRGHDLQPGAWNDFDLEVVGETYTVRLNGQQTTTFTNPEPRRGQSPREDPLFGYIGVHANPFNPGHVDFRAIRIQELPAASSASATPTESTPEVASPAATPVTAPVAVVWQTEGGPDLPFKDPFQLAIDPDGNLWVADGQNSRFQIFAPDGSFLETWGTSGSAKGQFDFVGSSSGSLLTWDPTGALAFDSAGNLYVVDNGNHRIQKFAPDRTFLTTWGSEGSGDGQFGHPFDIAIDADGRVYVIDDQRDDVQVFDGNGRFLFAFGGHGSADGQLNYTGGLAIDQEGAVWIADHGNHRVQQFSSDGTLLAVVGGLGTDEGAFIGPIDLAVDGHGRVYVVEEDNNRVQVFDGDGRYLARFASPVADRGEFAVPEGIALDGAGHAYISDSGADRVTKFRLLPPLALAGTPTP